MTRNFVLFLELYRSFAGEDLAESEDETAVESNEDESRPRG
jgi:proton-coupled amino acid transporter